MYPKNKIIWEKAHYENCWKGVYSEDIHFTLIQSRERSFILQIPGALAKGRGLLNVPCDSFAEAQKIAEQYM